MNRKTTYTLVAVGIIIGIVAVPALAAFLDNSVPVQGGVTLHAASGPAVNITESADVNLTAPFPASDTVRIESSAGNLTASGSDFANVTVTTINGTWTNTTDLELIGKTLTLAPDDKSNVTLGGDITAFEWRQSITADDGTPDFTYTSSIGSGSVALTGLAASTQYLAADASTGEVLDVETSDGSGDVTFSGLESGSHAVELETTAGGPTLSNPSPDGEVSSSPDELSIDVTDPDFPNDEVEVAFWLDGSNVDTVNVTSNGTVTTSSVGSIDLGAHTWAANVTDAYGQNTVEVTDFELPSNVTFRNETNASQIIAGVNLTATFYSEDGTTIVQRSDSDDDGNISLEGLPNTEFVVVIEADGYYTRRVYLESIFEQSNIYLLNSTAFPNAIDTTFVYEDRTGLFPPEETTLRVQRGVDTNGDGNFTWATVAGDFWGAAGEFPFTGETNARYRLIIENSEGVQRNLGTHIPTADGTKNIIVGQLEWPIINSTARGFAANLSTESQSILATYSDPDDDTSDVRVRVYEYNNESNEIYDENFTSGPYGTLNTPIALTENQTDQSWIVEFTAQTDDDGEVSGEVVLGGSSLALPIDPWLLGTFGWIAVTFIACLYGPRTSTLGAWVLVLFVGILATLQWVSVPGGAAAIIVAAGIAFAGTVYKEAMPG